MKAAMNLPRRSTPSQRTALALAMLSLLAALGACSSVPARNAALDLARSRLDAAQAQPQVVTLAPEELKRAADALRTAQAAQQDGQGSASVDHLSYLASQQVAIAQDAASSRAAQAVTAGAGAERDRIRLAMRTQEADSTRQQLDSAQRSNAAQAGQLAAAAAGAQDDQARLARRDAQPEEMQGQMAALNARKTDRGMVVTLGDVLFATGQSRLQADGDRTMDKVAEFLRRYPQRSAAIEGYTDSVGSSTANQALSDRRAQAVKDALVGLGVPGDKLRSRGFGEARPVASNDTAEGRQMNRRVELVFAPDPAETTPR